MNRRHFLTTTAAACGGTLSSQAAPGIDIVDCHTHFYDPTRKDGVPWPDKDSPLYRPVMPEHWRKLAAPHGIRKTVVVEASNRLEDNQWILDLAAKETCIVGFVGHLAPQEAAFEKNLKRFAANPIFRGIRVSNVDFLDHVGKPEFRAGAKLLADMDLQLDINGPGAFHMPLAKLAADIPALRVVVDHVGSAGDPTHLSAEWRDGMKALGKLKNVFCKVSALVEQTDNETWGTAPRDTAFYLPILDHVWDCFGEDRVIFGSNWPVSDKGASFDVLFKIAHEYFSSKGKTAEEKYFHANSKSAYKWITR